MSYSYLVVEDEGVTIIEKSAVDTAINSIAPKLLPLLSILLTHNTQLRMVLIRRKPDNIT